MTSIEVLREKLEGYLRSKFPRRQDQAISGLVRLSGGLSHETYSVDLKWKDDRGPVLQSLVMLVEPEFGCAPPYDIVRQCDVMARVGGAGIPVPKVLWLERDASILGRPFFVTEKVEGHNYHSYCKDHPKQSRLIVEYVVTLARIHRLDWRARGLSTLLASQSNGSHAKREIDRWSKVIKENRYAPEPLLAETIVWLRRHVPAARRTTLCHGDFIPGNLLAVEDRIVAVLDWEMASLGDPTSDLAWVCAFISSGKIRFWTEADLLHCYEEEAGITVDRESLFFWRVLSYVKLIGITLASLRTGVESDDIDVRHLASGTTIPHRLRIGLAQMLGI